MASRPSSRSRYYSKRKTDRAWSDVVADQNAAKYARTAYGGKNAIAVNVDNPLSQIRSEGKVRKYRSRKRA